MVRLSSACILAVLPSLGAALNLLDPGAILNLLAGLKPAPDSDPRWTNWKPPGPGDVRSPCPGLNALANHGFLHHDGRNLTIPHLLQGLAAGLNIGADFTTVIGAAGLLSTADPLAGAFKLDDLDEHNFPIEHDASLSRQDAFFGNNYSFNRTTWQTVLDSFAGSNVTSLASAVRGKLARVDDSAARNPQFEYGAREFVLSYGELGLMLQTMGDTTSGVSRVDFIRSLFEHERLPFNLGWRTSKDPVTLLTLGDMIVAFSTVNPQALPEGVKVVADSYKDLLSAAVGGSLILGNLTQGISSALGL